MAYDQEGHYIPDPGGLPPDDEEQRKRRLADASAPPAPPDPNARYNTGDPAGNAYRYMQDNPNAAVLEKPPDGSIHGVGESFYGGTAGPAGSTFEIGDNFATRDAQAAKALARSDETRAAGQIGNVGVNSNYDYTNPDSAEAVNVNSGRAFVEGSDARAASINRSQDQQFRAAQTGLVTDLQRASAGGGPSAATMQLNQGIDAGLRASLAREAASRGGDPGLRARRIAQAQSDANTQAAMGAAQIKLQEQLAAREQLAGVAGGARSQDIGVNTSQAGLTQQATLANQSNALQAQTVNAGQELNLAELEQQRRLTNAAQDLQSQGMNQQQALAIAQQEINRQQSNAVLEQGQEHLDDARQQYNQGLGVQLNEVPIAEAQEFNQRQVNRDVNNANVQQGKTGALDVITGVTKIAAEGTAAGLKASDERAKTDIKKLSPADRKTDIVGPLGQTRPGALDMDAIVSHISSTPRQRFNATASSLGGAASNLGGAIRDRIDSDNLTGDTISSLSSANSPKLMQQVIPRVPVSPLYAESDHRNKEQVSTERDPNSWLNHLNTYEYRYKDPNEDGAAPGRHKSVMAQELQETREGRSMLTKNDEGHLMVDYGEGLPLMLAALAEVNKKVDALGARRKK